MQVKEILTALRRQQEAQSKAEVARDIAQVSLGLEMTAHAESVRLWQEALKEKEAKNQRVWTAYEASEKDVARLREAIEKMAERRENFHNTYNGGYHEDDLSRVFHHGMDTVFNALDEWKRQALEPTKGSE